jgi:ribosomal protein S30
MYRAGKCRNNTPRVPKKVHDKKPARGRAAMRKAYNKQFLSTNAHDSEAIGSNSHQIPVVPALFAFDPMTLNDVKTGEVAEHADVQTRADRWIQSHGRLVQWLSGTVGRSGLDW